MKHFKRCAAAFLCSAMVLGALSGHAEIGCGTLSLPCGHTGASCTLNNCANGVCTLCGGYDCGEICQSVFWTAAPAFAAIAPSAQPVQTPAPQVTAVPTAAPVTEATKTPSQSMGDYTTESLSAQEQKAWNLLNQDRMYRGLAPLPLDPQLSAIARAKSRDMDEKDYFAHTSPTYGSAADMLRAFGYIFSAVGENIAHHATVEKSQAAFMTSDGHKRNILGANWTKVGIGVWQDAQGYVYVTQLFAR